MLDALLEALKNGRKFQRAGKIEVGIEIGVRSESTKKCTFDTEFNKILFYALSLY